MDINVFGINFNAEFFLIEGQFLIDGQYAI